MPPPSTARQFFGVGTKPVDEYFAPVVPSMAGRLTGNQNLDARQWLEQNRMDVLQNQFAQQQEALQQQEFERQQAEQQRQFQRRFQTVMGPEWENAQLQSYQQKIGKQQQDSKAMQQKEALFSALSGLDVRSDAGRKEVDRLIGSNPLAASDVDVNRYLTARGYDPRNKDADREEYRRESWLGRLPTEDRMMAEEQLGAGVPLSAAQSAIAQQQKNREWKSKILSSGIDPKELASFQDERGNYSEELILPKLYQMQQQRRVEVTPAERFKLMQDMLKMKGELDSERQLYGDDSPKIPTLAAQIALNMQRLGLNTEAPQTEVNSPSPNQPEPASYPKPRDNQINLLRQHPERAKEFDQMFGPGSAQMILGK